MFYFQGVLLLIARGFSRVSVTQFVQTAWQCLGQSVWLWLESVFGPVYMTVTRHAVAREPRRLKPSDLAPVLQYGRGPFADFLAKILRVDTQQKKEHSQEMNMGGLHHRHTCYQLSYLGELIVRKLQNKIVYYKETKILARKSGKGPLPYWKIGAESEDLNQQGSLVREIHRLCHGWGG
jgi:hypothetical protein